MSRVTTTRLLAIAAGLDERDRHLIEELAMLRLASHAQLAQLLPVSPNTSVASQARTARRVLARLSDLTIFARSELYVQARRAEQAGRLELLDFAAEPACWRPFIDGFGGQTILKPDAYVQLGLGSYESRFFVEADLGSESRGVIERKARAYLAYFNAGLEQAEHGVFPRVLFATTSERRRAALVEVCTRMPEESWQLFTVTTLDRAIEVMSNT